MYVSTRYLSEHIFFSTFQGACGAFFVTQVLIERGWDMDPEIISLIQNKLV